MAGWKERNDTLENEKLAKQEMLRGLFVRLSDEVEKSGYAPGVGGQITGALREKKAQLDSMLEDRTDYVEARRKRNALEAELGTVSEKAERETADLTEEYKILGAILFEQRSSGTLDPAITLIDADWEEYSAIRKDMETGFWKRMIRGMDKSHFDRSRDEKYYRYGTGLFENGQEDLVRGGNAERAVGKIKTLRGKLGERASEMEELRAEIAKVPVLSSAGRDDIEELRAEVWALKANHGQYLYDNGQKWLREDTPASLMDIIEEILKGEQALSDIDSRISGLSEEAERSEIRLLIEENRRRVEILRNEKKMIDEKILSLEREIERMEESLGK